MIRSKINGDKKNLGKTVTRPLKYTFNVPIVAKKVEEMVLTLVVVALESCSRNCCIEPVKELYVHHIFMGLNEKIDY